MVARDPERYREHSQKTLREHGFVPTYPDLEARHFNENGRDTTKLWLGEVIDTFKFITFDLPNEEDPHFSIPFGTENQKGEKINPRFPLGELSVTRIKDTPNPDQIMITLQIFMHDKNNAHTFMKALVDEMFSLKDITGDGRTMFYSRFEQGIRLDEDVELSNSLKDLVEEVDPPLFTSIKTSRIYNIGPRNAEFMLSEAGMFTLENAAA